MNYPAVLGFDVAGEVVQVGDGVMGLKTGDRVMAYVIRYTHKLKWSLWADMSRYVGELMDGPSTGAFAEYVLSPSSTVIAIPAQMSFTEAVVLPSTMATAAFSLYSKHLLALEYPSTGSESVPKNKEKVVMVYGGSSGVGTSAIQLANASGYTVFTAAGSHNFDKVKEVGASEVFDHSSSTLVDDISSVLQGRTVVGIFDAITNDQSMSACRAIARASGLGAVVGVQPGQEGNVDGVEFKMVEGLRFAGSEVAHRVFEGYIRPALEEGRVLPRPEPLVVGQGLGSIQMALDRLQAGVSAKKIVVTM
jgi:NADPH:quinone reductase-like Zn-dependent oxidoreductase